MVAISVDRRSRSAGLWASDVHMRERSTSATIWITAAAAASKRGLGRDTRRRRLRAPANDVVDHLAHPRTGGLVPRYRECAAASRKRLTRAADGESG